MPVNGHNAGFARNQLIAQGGPCGGLSRGSAPAPMLKYTLTTQVFQNTVILTMSQHRQGIVNGARPRARNGI